MNSAEPSALLYTRLSSLDPESASKIMGFILIHGPNEADMTSLATAPDAVLHQLILKGKNYSRVLTGRTSSFPPNGFASASNLSSPRPIPSNSASLRGIKTSPSYASVVNGGGATFDAEAVEDGFTFPEALSFLNERSKNDDLYDLGVTSPRSFHKRSLSLSDAHGGGVGGGLDEMSGGGVGWRPCMYFARGFCRNGSCCKFLHSGFDDDDVVAANLPSPGKFDGFEHELLRSRATQQQQRLALASQIMSGSSFPYNKYFTDSPRSKAAAMMMEEELQKLSMMRHDNRGDFGTMGCSSGSRQIYLTFPADSTFREEDVSNYFSIYGPVQDVRIPYQQKRMFGFVTFVHPETVKIILAKGNPHFVCDSRVLVKPYKEKGKVEKKHLLTQQQLERGDLSSCSSPHGVDIRDFDVPIGPRMFYNNSQDLLMRRKLEEQEFQQALEMQSRKMANLQLLDINNLSRRHPFSPNHNLSPAASMSSPTSHQILLSPNHLRAMVAYNQEILEENYTAPTLSLPPHALGNRQTLTSEGYSNVNNCNEYITSNTNETGKLADSGDNGSIDLVLPETLDDTTPLRLAAAAAAPSHQSIFSSAMLSMNENAAAASSSQFSSNSGTIVSSACLSNMAPPKSCFLDDPSCH